jgi:cytidine deaminase
VALFRALADGDRVFDAVAVVADTQAVTPPCGACRQLLWEYCGDVPIVLADLSSIRERLSLADLLPRPFGAHLLD